VNQRRKGFQWVQGGKNKKTGLGTLTNRLEKCENEEWRDRDSRRTGKVVPRGAKKIPATPFPAMTQLWRPSRDRKPTNVTGVQCRKKKLEPVHLKGSTKGCTFGAPRRTNRG